MRSLLPAFTLFITWTTASLWLYQSWFLDGRDQGQLATASLLSSPPDPEGTTLADQVPEAVRTPVQDILAGNVQRLEWQANGQPDDPAEEDPGVDADIPFIALAPASESHLEQVAELCKAENDALLLLCLPSGIPSSRPAEKQDWTNYWKESAMIRANSLRTRLFELGVEPAQSVIALSTAQESQSGQSDFADLLYLKPRGKTDPVSSALDWSEDAGPLAALLLSRHFAFRYGSSVLPEDGETTDFFRNIAEYLNQHEEKSVYVCGHTCDISSSGFNQRLGEARAAAVRERLMAMGIAPHRVTSGSAGEQFPVADNSLSEGQAANRRVDLLIY